MAPMTNTDSTQPEKETKFQPQKFMETLSKIEATCKMQQAKDNEQQHAVDVYKHLDIPIASAQNSIIEIYKIAVSKNKNSVNQYLSSINPIDFTSA